MSQISSSNSIFFPSNLQYFCSKLSIFFSLFDLYVIVAALLINLINFLHPHAKFCRLLVYFFVINKSCWNILFCDQETYWMTRRNELNICTNNRRYSKQKLFLLTYLCVIIAEIIKLIDEDCVDALSSSYPIECCPQILLGNRRNNDNWNCDFWQN